MALIIWFIRIVGILSILTCLPLQYAIGMDNDPVNVRSFIVLQIAYFILGLVLILFAKRIVHYITLFFRKLFAKKENRFANYLILFFIVLLLSLYPIYIFSIVKHLPQTNAKIIGLDFLIASREVVSVWNIIGNSFSMPYEVDRDKLEIPIYDVYLRQHKIDSLNSNLPESGKDYKNGYIEFDNLTLDVKIKYRGGWGHWSFPKKSFAIKYNRSDVTNFTRRFDLIIPERAMQFERTFYDFIGKQLGLLSPDCEDVAIFLNKKYYGHFQKYEYVDESFLRKNGKLPGMIYKGDYSNVFYNPDEWDIRATFTEDNTTKRQLIHILLNNITNATNIEFYDFTNKHFKNILPYIAYLHFLGDTHVNDNHNHIFYFDPSSGKFEPIINDPTMTPAYFNLNKGTNLLIRRISKYPDLVYEKNKILYDYVTSDKINELQLFLDKLEKTNSYAIKKDLYKHKDNSNYFISYGQWKKEVQRIRERIDYFQERIIQDLETANVTFYPDVGLMEVSGHAPVIIDNIIYYPGLKKVSRKKWAAFDEYEPATLVYSVNVSMPLNAITGKEIYYSISPGEPKKQEIYSLHPDTYIKLTPYFNNIHYDNTIIKGGIFFQEKNAYIYNVTFIGGGEFDYGLVHYSGQLSAYNSNITCVSCKFINSNTEDMINVKNGNAIIVNSTFINAHSDAIDLDLSTGLIEGNIFINITNDAIDLMTSDPKILNNIIISAKDKAMSIGEQSKPIIENNLIKNSKFGIVSKDGSYPTIIRNTIINSTIADIAAYAKNWRYSDGGHGLLINNTYDTLLLDENVTGEPFLDYFNSSFENDK